MEQCTARLDVAMFNAILRKSADEVPADPESNPITNPKVLPIPAGNLSFKAGMQLKHVVRKFPFKSYSCSTTGSILNCIDKRSCHQLRIIKIFII